MMFNGTCFFFSFFWGKVLHSLLRSACAFQKKTRDKLPLTAEGSLLCVERFFTLAAQRARSPQKKHGMRSHSPRKGQRPRSSCLAAAKG
jgi:hypothetical protein